MRTFVIPFPSGSALAKSYGYGGSWFATGLDGLLFIWMFSRIKIVIKIFLVVIILFLYFAASSKYGPRVPVSLLFPGPTFCKSSNIFMLVATIHLTAKKVTSIFSLIIIVY